LRLPRFVRGDTPFPADRFREPFRKIAYQAGRGARVEHREGHRRRLGHRVRRAREHELDGVSKAPKPTPSGTSPTSPTADLRWPTSSRSRRSASGIHRSRSPTRSPAALKQLVADVLNEHLRPIRARRTELTTQPEHLRSVLHDGNERAREIAATTLNTVRELMDTTY
jgi:hypothetical protein